MEEIVVKRFITNVRTLAKRRGIGKMERECGVVPGYLNRAVVSKTKGISLITAMKMSHWVGYSLEDLMYKDIWREEKEAEISEEARSLK